MPRLSDDELKEALAASPSTVRITPETIQGRIKAITYHRLLDTVTICNIVLDNGYSVRGESACVDPANYRKEIGERVAYDDAFRKLWPLFGFLLAEKRWLQKPTS